MKRCTCCVALLCAWTGCTLFHRDDPHDQPRAAEHTVSDGGAPLGPSAASASAGARASASDVAAAAGGMAVAAPEVWIGQLLSDSSPLCDSVRGDRSASFASDALDKTERLVIVLEARAGGG
jgi:hypothetical protein